MGRELAIELAKSGANIALAEIDETTDPEVYALTESAILECEELLSSSKFYDC